MLNSLEKTVMAVSKRMGLTGLKIKAKAPEILLVTGIVTMVGAVGSAIAATRKTDEIFEEHEENLETAKAEVIMNEDGTQEERDEKEINTEVRKVYVNTTWKLAKAYAPTIALMGASVASFVSMHNIQARRIAGLSGAYTSLKAAFDAYQKNNIELNGQENHEMCKYGYKEADELDENGNENGKKKKVVNKAEDVAKDPTYSDSFIIWDKHSPSFTGDRNYDMITINNCKRYIEDLIKVRGYAIENDIRDYLKVPRTEKGMILGKVKGQEGSEEFVEICEDVNYEFLNCGRYKDIVITINNQGNVYSLLTTLKEGRNSGAMMVHAA